ncbi:hypothetical protein HPB50_005641 [Hyalomma asiaticum]|uniref:Uncharacterized protein n=1 Tax=Hyalomma asiaticum TaxID=266040 RepID=A0ACB7T3I5_HYAAI|nr:hypothetical protein HPB50_005641 [Hyalomma asiaticum]
MDITVLRKEELLLLAAELGMDINSRLRKPEIRAAIEEVGFEEDELTDAWEKICRERNERAEEKEKQEKREQRQAEIELERIKLEQARLARSADAAPPPPAETKVIVIGESSAAESISARARVRGNGGTPSTAGAGLLLIDTRSALDQRTEAGQDRAVAQATRRENPSGKKRKPSRPSLWTPFSLGQATARQAHTCIKVIARRRTSTSRRITAASGRQMASVYLRPGKRNSFCPRLRKDEFRNIVMPSEDDSGNNA